MWTRGEKYCIETGKCRKASWKENILGFSNSESTSTLRTSDEVEKRKCACSINYRPFLGLFYTFLCSAFIVLSSVFVKKLTYISPGQLSLVRNAGVLVGCLPISIYSVKDILGPRQHRVLLAFRGFLGATALYLNLMAFRYLPLAEAAVIMSTLPALVSFTARIYLKEPCGLIQGCAVVVTVIGVLLSIRLPELLKNRGKTELTSTYIIGLSCAVACVIILSATFVTLRKMKDVHFSVILLYLSFIGVIENGVITGAISYYAWPRCGWDSFQVSLIGIFGFLGHCFLTLAVQTEAVGIVSVLKASLDIIISMVFQQLFFNSSPDLYNLGGSVLVMISVSIIGIKKWLVSLPDESNAKRKLKFLLL